MLWPSASHLTCITGEQYVTVARQGIDALLAGDDHVYAASMKTKLEGKLANVVPGAMKGARKDGKASGRRTGRTLVR
ncbi:MAG TPA: hypothetical protein VFE27_22020 [Acidobacteriaceae bacterium]|nr:hypothetical protein [Acidobacteriaceae bacterium]